jgi:hypothetical protein
VLRHLLVVFLGILPGGKVKHQEDTVVLIHRILQIGPI